MNKLWILIIYLIVVIAFIYTYIIAYERERVFKCIRAYNSPINNVFLTLFSTKLVNKQDLYIRIFAPESIILHEIAHSLCNETGHTEQFNQILNSLTCGNIN